MDKGLLIAAVVEKLSEELESLLGAARAAREAATHEESKPEDQYDTRGLEASYLAGAQAERAAQLQRTIAFYKFMPPQDARLFEVESGGRRLHYLLVPQGGGLSVRSEGKLVQVITPQAPLGDALLDRKDGDEVEVEIAGSAPGAVREYRIISVT